METILSVDLSSETSPVVQEVRGREYIEYSDASGQWKNLYPNFLIDSNSVYEDTDLYEGLVINKFILKRFVFEPNRIRFPEVRERIEKKLNEKK